MVGAEHLLTDGQRAFVERPRRDEIALLMKHVGEVGEARRSIAMLGAEHLLADRQRTREKWAR